MQAQSQEMRGKFVVSFIPNPVHRDLPLDTTMHKNMFFLLGLAAFLAAPRVILRPPELPTLDLLDQSQVLNLLRSEKLEVQARSSAQRSWYMRRFCSNTDLGSRIVWKPDKGLANC